MKTNTSKMESPRITMLRAAIKSADTQARKLRREYCFAAAATFEERALASRKALRAAIKETWKRKLTENERIY